MISLQCERNIMNMLYFIRFLRDISIDLCYAHLGQDGSVSSTLCVRTSGFWVGMERWKTKAWHCQNFTARVLSDDRPLMAAPLFWISCGGGIRRHFKDQRSLFFLSCVTQSLNDWFKLPKLLPSVQNIYRCNDLISGKLRSFALSKGRNCILPSSCPLSLSFHTRQLPILRAL